MLKNLYATKGWTTAKTEYSSDAFMVKLSVNPRKRFSCHYCGRKGVIHSKRTIYIVDSPCVEKKVIIELEVPQIFCPTCGRFHTCRPDFVHPTMKFTWRLMRLISGLLVYVPARKLAEMFSISYSSVLRIDREFLRTCLTPPCLDGIEGILVDEKYLGPSHGFVTLVLNASTGEPLHLAAGKNGEAFESFLNRLTDKQKRSIQYLGIDRANAYRSAALKHLPWVKVCFDAFHLVSNMNEVVDKVRRAEFAHPTEAQRRRITGRRYILLKAKESLSEHERMDLNELCALNQNLTKTYILKEQFRTIFSHLTEHAAMWQLSQWIGMAVRSGVKQVERFARGIAHRYNEVINSIRYNINSARIESANAAIKRTQSKCCGLFDIEYLFMKLRQMYLSGCQAATQQG